MKITVDQQVVPAELVTYNDGLGYGRFDKGDIEVHSYSLYVDRESLIEKLHETYQVCCEEIKRDDAICGEPSSFQVMGYSSLREAFDHPEQLAEVITTYFQQDIFQSYLPGGEDATFVINSTDKVLATNDGVLIEGRCFKHRLSSRGHR